MLKVVASNLGIDQNEVIAAAKAVSEGDREKVDALRQRVDQFNSTPENESLSVGKALSNVIALIALSRKR